MSQAQHEFNELMRDKHRRTRHPEDGEDDDDDLDGQSFLNLSDDEDRTPPASHLDIADDPPPRPSFSSARNTIPITRYGANTGPKGVISDAQHFRDSRRMHRHSVRSVTSVVLPAQNGASHVGHRPPSSAVEKLDEDEFDGDDDDADVDENDDFMQQWRSSRLRALQNGAYQSRMHTRGARRRLFGALMTVDGDSFLDAVDRSPSDVVVVVYICDDCSEVSVAIEDCIRALARRHLNTRFIKLNYQVAEMEPAGVPALLAYRGGDKFAGLVPLIHDLPEEADLSPGVLESVLRRHRVLQ